MVNSVGAGGSSAMLRVGSRGREVTELKTELRREHYLVDGGNTFTQATRDAVIAFQKINHLDRDGVVGPQTQQALAHPRTAHIGRGAADRVVVDLSDQVLMKVTSGQLDYIVHASTGTTNWADGSGVVTPQGDFRVFRKVHGADVAPLGVLYSPSYFNGGIAVHGEPEVPVYPGSHGCVRVPMWTSERLYREMPVGEPVTVRR